VKRWISVIAIAVIALIAASPAWAAQGKPVKPAARDKCPVCGMFVAKYPDFVAQVIYKDGSYAVFDGAKDMFKYYFNLKKYAPTRTIEEMASIYVTDYYSLEPVEGTDAWYVTGSDVFGPMGKELIPFGKESDARGFMKDHRGKSLLRFKDIHMELIRELD
jgi:nitrous oxide reductase accessory protein NosL